MNELALVGNCMYLFSEDMYSMNDEQQLTFAFMT